MKRRNLKKTFATGVAAAVAALCAAGAALAFANSQQANPIRTWNTPANVRIPLLAASLRPKYPYSIVPGGVYSPAELDQAIRKDPLIREHFAGFNIKQAHLIRLTKDHYGYLSYRLGNQVFWTKRPLRLPKNEVLLTDGSHYVRCRCANRISETAQLSLAKVEPLESLLDRPSITLDNLRDFDFAEPPELADVPVLPLQLELLHQFDSDSLLRLSDTPMQMQYIPQTAHSRLWMAALPLAAIPIFLPHHKGNSFLPSNDPNPPSNPPIIPPLSPVPEPAELCAVLIAVAGLVSTKILAIRRRRAP